MARKGAGMTLKQIQEEEIKKFDALMGEIGHKTITTGKPVDTEAMVKQFLLSAMEASARGAIEEDHQQLLKAVEEMKIKVCGCLPFQSNHDGYCSSPEPGWEEYNKALSKVSELLKAKDYIQEFDNQIPREGL